MKLQTFASLRIDDDGFHVIWRQGYHRQISGQSVHVADMGQKWDMQPEFGHRWAAYDDDSGMKLVTAPTMRECIALCETYIARNSAMFVSDEYVALCKLFLALRKVESNDDGQRVSRKLYALLKHIGAYEVLVGLLDTMPLDELEERLDCIAYERNIEPWED